MSAVATAVVPPVAAVSPLLAGSWVELEDGAVAFGWRVEPGASGAGVAEAAAVRLAATVVAVGAVESIDPLAIGRARPVGVGPATGSGRATVLRVGPQRVLVAVELTEDRGGRRRFLVTLRRRA